MALQVTIGPPANKTLTVYTSQLYVANLEQGYYTITAEGTGGLRTTSIAAVPEVGLFGSMDDVAIYNRVLTDAEIIELGKR